MPSARPKEYGPCHSRHAIRYELVLSVTTFPRVHMGLERGWADKQNAAHYREELPDDYQNSFPC